MKYSYIWLFALLLISSPALILAGENDPASPYNQSDNRYLINLSGKWQKSIDGNEWSTGLLPSSEKSGGRLYYKKIINISNELINKYNWLISFMGIDDQAEVYFNEQYVGQYYGGMTPFEVRIPRRMLRSGSNSIKFVVSPASSNVNHLRSQSIFAKRQYTGVLRELFLVGVPIVWISDAKYSSTAQTGGNFNLKLNVSVSAGDLQENRANGNDISFKIQGKKETISVDASLRTPDGLAVISQSGERSISVEKQRTSNLDISMFVNSPNLWNFETPNLYRLNIRISKNGSVIDEIWKNVGFRDIRAGNDGNKNTLFLNGKPFEVKGINYIEDYFMKGQSLSRRQIENDVELIKTLGANTINFKFSPPHPYMAYLCDKAGIFIMVDLPVYQAPSSILNMDEIKVRLKNTARRYISTYDSHPSLLAWGVGEGLEEGTDATNEYYKFVAESFRSNSQQLIYKTVLGEFGNVNTDFVDFVGIQFYRNNHSFGHMKEVVRNMSRMLKNKPFFMTFGYPIQVTNHNGYSDPLSIEAQAHYILNSFYVSQDEKSAGNVINSFNDYILDNPALVINNEDMYLCSSGLVSRKREQRLSYNTLQSVFNNEKKPLLNAGSYTEKTPVTFIIVGIVLGIVLVLLINRFRRFREYLFRSMLRPYNFYADIRDQRIMSTVQTALLGVVISATLGIYLSSLFYYFRTDIVPQYIFALFFPQAGFQEWFFRLIWMAELNLVVLTILIFLVAGFIALIIRGMSFFSRNKIFISDTFTIVIWSGVPFLVLLPFSIVLTRLLVYSPAFSTLSVVILAISLVWVWMRILKSTSVVFDLDPLKVYLTGWAVLILVLVFTFTIYQIQYLLFPYIGYLTDVMLKI